MLDPDSDLAVKGFFQALPKSDYLPTWYQERINKPKDNLEWQAAEKTSHHANTPTLAYFDTLGRPFLSIADNGTAGKYATRTELDIEGNQRAVIDAKDRVVMRYDYDLLGNRIHQASMEAGERWMLNDVTVKPIRAWNSRGHSFRTEYDQLRRPLQSFVVGSDANNLTGEVLYEKSVYGEQQGDINNHRGRVYQAFDSAGVVTNEAYNFKGNLLNGTRQIVRDYKTTPDWSYQPILEDEIFASHTIYDALNRPITLTTPDKSIIKPAYNEANLLDNLKVNLRGAETATIFVKNIDYNAKSQREKIEYGNQTKTEYAYDEKTFRLTALKTLRSNTALQDLSYTYDPAGNITHIRDDAQQTIFFRNRCVEPSTDYVYDAIYRLIQATGREHLGQASDGCPFGPVPTSHTDQPRVGLIHPGDGQAMSLYQESYEYDAVGNFLRLLHRSTDPQHAGWTREYLYQETSLLEPGEYSNRLSGTKVGETAEPYSFDSHGNMLSMPHLKEMLWDFKDQLQSVDLGGGGKAYYVYDASGQRVRKVHEHNGYTVEERLYLGGFEVYRKRQSGEIKLERETLHIMDDKQRIALVETKTQDIDESKDLLASIIRYQLGNHLGSASLELDFEGAVISYEEFYPYGSTSYQAGLSAAEVSLKRYRFTGKERDEETGLSYHSARYYSPWLSRWINCDPTGVMDGVNVYQYSHCNPQFFVDPNGKQNQVANDTDPNNPNNYVSFEDFKSGAFGPYTEEGLRTIWDEAHSSNSTSSDSHQLDAGVVDTNSSQSTATQSEGYNEHELLSAARIWSNIPNAAVRITNPLVDVAPTTFGLSAANPSALLSPAEHALGQHLGSATGTPFISASMRPGGATGFQGSTRLWIDIDKATSLGAEFISEEALAADMEALARSNPRFQARAEMWSGAQAAEREVLFRGPIDPRAIDSAAMRYMRYGGRGLQVAAVGLTVYDLGQATRESIRVESPAPLAAETVRQVGSWGGAWAGAKIGAGLGALAGIETGPGAVLTGLGGAIIFGTAGYFGADWVADYIYSN